MQTESLNDMQEMVGKKAEEGRKDRRKRRKEEKEIIFYLNTYVCI